MSRTTQERRTIRDKDFYVRKIKLEQVKGNSEKAGTKHWKEEATTVCSLQKMETKSLNLTYLWQQRNLNLVGKVSRYPSSVGPHMKQQLIIAPVSLENCSSVDRITWTSHFFCLLIK